MFKIIHAPEQQVSWPLDPNLIEGGSIQEEEYLDWLITQSYMTGLKAGRVVTLERAHTSPGTYKGTALSATSRVRAALYNPATADETLSGEGSAPNVLKAFVAVDATYAGYYNKPNVASLRLAVVPIMPGVVIETDEFDTTFADVTSGTGSDSSDNHNGASVYINGGTAGVPGKLSLTNSSSTANINTVKIGVATVPVVPSHHVEREYGITSTTASNVTTQTTKVIRVYCV